MMPQEIDSTEELTEDELRSAFVDAIGSDDDPEEVVDDNATQEESAETGPDGAGAGGDQAGEEPAGEPADEGAEEGHPSASLEGLLQKASEYGISIDGIKSEAELSERVLGQIRRMQDIVYRSQQQAIQQYAQQNTPAQAPPQEKPVENEWSPSSHFSKQYGGPEWKDSYNEAINAGIVQRDPESGMWTPAAGFEAAAGQIASEINAAQQHAAQFWQGMTRGNPYEKIYQAIADPIERRIQERVDEILSQRMQETSQQSAVSRFEQEHGSWLYQTDPDTGRQVLTDQGRQFTDTVSALREDGIRDPARLLELAQKITGFGSQQPAQTQPPQAAQPTTAPPLAQSVAGGAVPQEAQQQSFLESAQRRAQHSPSARGRASEDAPQVMTQGDLESLFVRAHKEASTT